MNGELSKQDVLRIAAGVAIFAGFFFVLWLYRQDPARQLASKATRVDVVGRMQAALTAASEAEKSAVLASTDQDSQTYADQARAAAAEVERARLELGRLLASAGTPGERELLARFSEAFAGLQRVDDQVLRLAVMNTNVKAYGLAFGPAADTLAELDGALARVEAKRAGAPDAARVLLLSSGARIALLRIQAMLAPHVAEESAAKMDQLEARMRDDETQARKALADLAALPGLAGDADLTLATARFARYGELERQIVILSRQNSNVQSLALSLNEKRKALVQCLDALNTLKQAILDEPIPGVSYGRVPTR